MRFEDRYELQVPLGETERGSVWSAKDADQKRNVAIAVLDKGADEEAREHFLEINLAARMARNPALVRIYETGETSDGALFAAMELLDGDSLRARLQRGPDLPLLLTVRALLEVLAGLQKLHDQEIAHGDICPSNIIIQQTGERVSLRLVGLGMGREHIRGGGLPLDDDQQLLSLAFMSPAQAQGEVVRDPASDVFSMAGVIYAVLTGHPPHHGTTVDALRADIKSSPVWATQRARPELGGPIAEVMTRALGASGYETASALAKALGDALDEAKGIETLRTQIGPLTLEPGFPPEATTARPETVPKAPPKAPLPKAPPKKAPPKKAKVAFPKPKTALDRPKLPARKPTPSKAGLPKPASVAKPTAVAKTKKMAPVAPLPRAAEPKSAAEGADAAKAKAPEPKSAPKTAKTPDAPAGEPPEAPDAGETAKTTEPTKASQAKKSTKTAEAPSAAKATKPAKPPSKAAKAAKPRKPPKPPEATKTEISAKAGPSASAARSATSAATETASAPDTSEASESESTTEKESPSEEFDALRSSIPEIAAIAEPVAWDEAVERGTADAKTESDIELGDEASPDAFAAPTPTSADPELPTTSFPKWVLAIPVLLLLLVGIFALMALGGDDPEEELATLPSSPVDGASNPADLVPGGDVEPTDVEPTDDDFGDDDFGDDDLGDDEPTDDDFGDDDFGDDPNHETGPDGEGFSDPMLVEDPTLEGAPIDPAEAPNVTHVRLTGVPHGAAVYLDRARVSGTELEIVDDTRDHFVEVRLAGHRNFRHRFRGPLPAELAVRLEPRSAASSSRPRAGRSRRSARRGRSRPGYVTDPGF